MIEARFMPNTLIPSPATKMRMMIRKPMVIFILRDRFFKESFGNFMRDSPKMAIFLFQYPRVQEMVSLFIKPFSFGSIMKQYLVFGLCFK